MSYKTHLFNILEQSQPVDSTQDEQDHVTFDIPLLIRLFELVREDVKTDVDLHNLVERILSMKNQGVLTMQDYEDIAAASSTPDSGQDPKLESLKRLAGI
jgi:hypothetical protein